jgi:hypothetical protein
VRNLAEDNVGRALLEEATEKIPSRTKSNIALDRWRRFTEGNRCSILLSYGALAQEASMGYSTAEDAVEVQ